MSLPLAMLLVSYVVGAIAVFANDLKNRRLDKQLHQYLYGESPRIGPREMLALVVRAVLWPLSLVVTWIADREHAR